MNQMKTSLEVCRHRMSCLLSPSKSPSPTMLQSRPALPAKPLLLKLVPFTCQRQRAPGSWEEGGGTQLAPESVEVGLRLRQRMSDLVSPRKSLGMCMVYSSAEFTYEQPVI